MCSIRSRKKVFHKPRTTQVHLDETGSYLWPLIDGQKTVAQLADCMKQQFGEKAEPCTRASSSISRSWNLTTLSSSSTNKRKKAALRACCKALSAAFSSVL